MFVLLKVQSLRLRFRTAGVSLGGGGGGARPQGRGSRGGGSKGGNCPPTFCLNGMDMPVPPP